ncbi:MAG: mechanosensitive ion channel [Tissierellia bacterium]|nr:mechanosensitive ion channel [Tissierellia bacterium]
MSDMVQNMYNLAKEDERYGEKFFITIGIIVICILAIRLLRFIVDKLPGKEKNRYWIKEIGSYIILLVTGVGILYTWFNALEGLMAAFSIILGLSVIALKDLIMNVAGFFYLKAKRPFGVGDRIEIEGYYGDVVDIDFFQFSMAEVGNWLDSLDHTGRTIYIANRDIFTHPMANFSNNFPYIWRDITVPITHKSNEKKMRKFLEEIGTQILKEIVHKDQKEEETSKDLEDLGRNIELFDGNILPKVHMNVDGNGINITLRYLVPYREGGSYETKIWEEVLDRIDKETDIELSPEVLRVVHSEPDNRIQ